MLKREHRNVKQLFKMIENTPGKKTRQTTFLKLKNTLDAHMIAEEDVFYSRLKESNEKSNDEVLEAFEEHHLAKVISDEITDLPVDDDSWMAKIHVFKEMVNHHMKREETTVFRQARKWFTKEELLELGDEFESRRGEFIDGNERLIERKAA